MLYLRYGESQAAIEFSSSKTPVTSASSIKEDD